MSAVEVDSDLPAWEVELLLKGIKSELGITDLERGVEDGPALPLEPVRPASLREVPSDLARL